ncbi:nudix-type nucleoside diphosphatase, YffH/AdpP family [Roseovarius marisflavi]|uniref:ADP-ribose pyrophosphatase n=1 Tax=Roseovarius marisflavi TaxID=1054996 RepID=A0A1M7BVH3_9RHOB|nr:NUDIX domain-containing protein [Roseovarius marisflavi]SHL59012.1 nudix-type nucleoside diphosphatase, YffH/AdpP family [Roseovarius marisflavi]
MSGPLFIYGPLGCQPLLSASLGQDGVDLARIATLPEYEVTAQSGGPLMAGLCPGRSRVEGWLVTDSDAVARLAYLAEVFDLGAPVPVALELAGKTIEALTFPGHPGSEPWQQEAWASRWGDLIEVAAAEITALMARVPAGDLAGRLQIVLSRAAARVAARTAVPADLRSAADAGQADEIACDISHAGYFLSRNYTLRHPRFDGTMSAPMRREVFVATDAALVLPYDPVTDRVLLVEQFRMGPYGRGDPRPWMLEPVAGRMDAGETPEQTARRECLEEAGLELRVLEKISSHYCTPGYSTEYFHLFLGLCDLPEETVGQGGLASEQEDIRTHIIGYDRAMTLLTSGEANNGPLILSLMWLERERARLRASA